MRKKFFRKIPKLGLIIFITTLVVPSLFIFVFAKTSFYRNIRQFAETYTEQDPYRLDVSDGGCFLADTKITLADYNLKPINQLTENDRVIAFSSEGKPTVQKVKKVLSFKRNNYNQILLNDGTIIKVTDEHPFLTKLLPEGNFEKNNLKEFFTFADDLKIGDELYSLEKNKTKPLKIISLKKVWQPVKVYNLEIEKDETFLANSIIVHNIKQKAPPKPPEEPPVEQPPEEPPVEPPTAVPEVPQPQVVEIPLLGGLDPQAACGHLPASQQPDCQTAVRQANGSGNYSALTIQNDQVVNIDWDINYQSWLKNPHIDQDEWQKRRGELYSELTRNLNYDPCENTSGSLLEDCKSIAIEAYTNKVGGLDIGRATYALKNNQWQELIKLEQEFSQLYGGRVNFGQAKETYYFSNLRKAAEQLASTIEGVDGASLIFILENPELGFISEQDFKEISEGCRSSTDLLSCYQEKSKKILTDKGILSLTPPAEVSSPPKPAIIPTEVAAVHPEYLLIAKKFDPSSIRYSLSEAFWGEFGEDENKFLIRIENSYGNGQTYLISFYSPRLQETIAETYYILGQDQLEIPAGVYSLLKEKEEKRINEIDEQNRAAAQNRNALSLQTTTEGQNRGFAKIIFSQILKDYFVDLSFSKILRGAKSILGGIIRGQYFKPETKFSSLTDDLIGPQRVEIYTNLSSGQPLIVSGWSFEGKEIKRMLTADNYGKVIAALPPGNYTAFTQEPKDYKGEYQITVPIPDLSEHEPSKPIITLKSPSKVKIQPSYLNEDGTTTSLPDGQIVRITGSPTNQDRKGVEETCVIKNGKCNLDLPLGNYHISGDFTISGGSPLTPDQSYKGEIPFVVSDDSKENSFAVTFNPYVKEKEELNVVTGTVNFSGETSRGTEASILNVYAQGLDGQTYHPTLLGQLNGLYEIADLPDGSYTIHAQLLDFYDNSKIQAETKSQTFTIKQGIIYDENNQIPQDTSQIFDFPIDQMIAEPKITQEGNRYFVVTGSTGKDSFLLNRGEYQVRVEPFPDRKILAPDQIKLSAADEEVILNIGVIEKKKFWLVRLFNKLKELLGIKKAHALSGFNTLMQEDTSAETPLQQFASPTDKVLLTINLYEDKNKNSQYDLGEEQVKLAGVKVILEKTTVEEKYDLLEGWNLISLPLVPISVKTASDLINDVNRQGANVTTIAYYDNGRWQEFIRRETGDQYGRDFQLKPNTAYFLGNHQQSEWQLSGKPIEKQTLKLKKGWNAVGLDKSGVKAEDIIREINELKCKPTKCTLSPPYENADSLARWQSGLWDVFRQKIVDEARFERYGNNFEIKPTQGYLIRIKSPITYSFGL